MTVQLALYNDRSRRQARGKRSQRQGIQGETRVVDALGQGGWTILGQRVRTAAGEVDIVAERDGILTLVEVKTGPDLTTAAYALSARQQQRLLTAGAILQGQHPDWGRNGMRFDAWLVDALGRMQHIPDAFRDAA
ncbi:YraN family protein [Acidisoma cellulosilytica]|uniref:YraN family protein n=1 Tax=Acidisoma cellulosilyticum TaxID=2802395 RepID=A0A963Z0L7_9PROT|nr:YraN family protein [Acidisoma cellulosilyticum]MCB8879822.1 YraN family protein [Acidisoma cellulosilyticum]